MELEGDEVEAAPAKKSLESSERKNAGLGGDPSASSNDLNHCQLPPSSSSRNSPRNQGEIEEDYADFTDDFYSDGAEEIEEMIGSADGIEDHRQFRNNDITNNTNGRPGQAILNL